MGALGHVVGLERKGISRKRLCTVISFPLNDNVGPWSLGIHTCHVRFLDNGQEMRLAGQWFEETEPWLFDGRRALQKRQRGMAS